MFRQASTFGSVAAAFLVVLWSQSAMAQGSCGNIQFTEQITSQFPNAKDACLGVVERNGKEYAHFKARIVRIGGNAIQPRVEAEFEYPDGSYGEPVSFTPPQNARAKIQGQSYRYSDLVQGQELDVYLPPDRWSIAVTPEPDFATAQQVEEVPLTEPTEELAAALPSTASRLPWLAAFGVAFLGIGALLTGLLFLGSRSTR